MNGEALDLARAFASRRLWRKPEAMQGAANKPSVRLEATGIPVNGQAEMTVGPSEKK